MWKDGFGILRQKDWMVYWRLISTISTFIKHYLTNPLLVISCNNLLTIKFHQSIALLKGCHISPASQQLSKCGCVESSKVVVVISFTEVLLRWCWRCIFLLRKLPLRLEFTEFTVLFASKFTKALFFEMYKTNLEGLRWNQRITLWTDNVSERTQYRDDLRSTQVLDGNSALPGPCKGCQIDDVWICLGWDVYATPGGNLKFLLACRYSRDIFTTSVFFSLLLDSAWTPVAVPVGQVQMLPSKSGTDQRTAPQPPWLLRPRRAM